jgi:hypothetical protein
METNLITFEEIENQTIVNYESQSFVTNKDVISHDVLHGILHILVGKLQNPFSSEFEGSIGGFQNIFDQEFINYLNQRFDDVDISSLDMSEFNLNEEELISIKGLFTVDPNLNNKLPEVINNYRQTKELFEFLIEANLINTDELNSQLTRITTRVIETTNPVYSLFRDESTKEIINLDSVPNLEDSINGYILHTKLKLFRLTRNFG